MILSDDSSFTDKLPDRKYEIRKWKFQTIELCSLSIKRVVLSLAQSKERIEFATSYSRSRSLRCTSLEASLLRPPSPQNQGKNNQQMPDVSSENLGSDPSLLHAMRREEVPKPLCVKGGGWLVVRRRRCSSHEVGEVGNILCYRKRLRSTA